MHTPHTADAWLCVGVWVCVRGCGCVCGCVCGWEWVWEWRVVYGVCVGVGFVLIRRSHSISLWL